MDPSSSFFLSLDASASKLARAPALPVNYVSNLLDLGSESASPQFSLEKGGEEGSFAEVRDINADDGQPNYLRRSLGGFVDNAMRTTELTGLDKTLLVWLPRYSHMCRFTSAGRVME